MEQKYEIGQIVTNEKHNFQRKIRSVINDYRAKGSIGYSYYSDVVDDKFKQTGRWAIYENCVCSQEHLTRWIKGEA